MSSQSFDLMAGSGLHSERGIQRFRRPSRQETVSVFLSVTVFRPRGGLAEESSRKSGRSRVRRGQFPADGKERLEVCSNDTLARARDARAQPAAARRVEWIEAAKTCREGERQLPAALPTRRERRLA